MLSRTCLVRYHAGEPPAEESANSRAVLALLAIVLDYTGLGWEELWSRGRKRLQCCVCTDESTPLVWRVEGHNVTEIVRPLEVPIGMHQKTAIVEAIRETARLFTQCGIRCGGGGCQLLIPFSCSFLVVYANLNSNGPKKTLSIDPSTVL